MYKDTRKVFFLGILNAVFLLIDLDFFKNKNFSDFYQSNFLFHNIFWMKSPIFIMLIFYMLLKRSPFHLGTIINFVAMWQYKICLSFWQNICLIYKSCKNWSIRIKLGHFLAVSNLSLYKKNCGCMVDTFYRYSSKSCIVVLMYVPLSICLCDNNITSRTSSVMGFLQKLF